MSKVKSFLQYQTRPGIWGAIHSRLTWSLVAAAHFTSPHLNVIFLASLFFPTKLLFLRTEAVLYITVMHCILFVRVYCVWDAWSTLDWKCVFFGGCGELDRGQTSHSTSSSIVLQTVPARLAKRQPEETFSTLLVSLSTFLFLFAYSLSRSVIRSYSFFLFI